MLENIFRHLEMGESPEVAAEKGGEEVSLAVLAATLTSSVVFFPVTFLYGVSQFLFSALALAVVLALFASYFVAMTVVPLFCARFLKAPHHARHEPAEPAPRAARAHGALQSRASAGASNGCSAGTSGASGASLDASAAGRRRHRRRCSSPASRCIRCSASRSSRAPTPGSSSST